MSKYLCIKSWDERDDENFRPNEVYSEGERIGGHFTLIDRNGNLFTFDDNPIMDEMYDLSEGLVNSYYYFIKEEE